MCGALIICDNYINNHKNTRQIRNIHRNDHQLLMPKQVKIQRKHRSEFVLSSLIYKLKECEVCQKKHNQASMILCDRCEDAYHIQCINLNHVPTNIWMCSRCHHDLEQIRSKQLMCKNILPSPLIQECFACKNQIQENFEYNKGQLIFDARHISLVTCSSCKHSFHNLCFSKRPMSINCKSCEQMLRRYNVPKGHSHFLDFINQNKMRITQLQYLQLNNEFDKIQMKKDTGFYPLMNLISPKMPNDWRQIATYEASLSYALATRNMIYCQNIVVESNSTKVQNIIKAHHTSVQKIPKLHPKNEGIYQDFKHRLQQGRMPPVQVQQDRKKGFYLSTSGFIQANTIIAQYTGQLITARESLSLETNDNIFALIRNPRSCDSLDIAPSRFANIGIFISGINNEDEQIKSLQNIRAVKFLYRGFCRVILLAMRDICENEALYLDYNGNRAAWEYPTDNFVK